MHYENSQRGERNRSAPPPALAGKRSETIHEVNICFRVIMGVYHRKDESRIGGCQGKKAMTDSKFEATKKLLAGGIPPKDVAQIIY